MHYDAESGLFLPRSRKALHERRLLEVKQHHQLLMGGGLPTVPEAVAIYNALVAWWPLDDNNASGFRDQHGTNPLSIKKASVASPSSDNSNTTAAKIAAGLTRSYGVIASLYSHQFAYIPDSNAALDQPNTSFTFFGWLGGNNNPLGAARFLFQGGGGQIHMYIDSADGFFKARIVDSTATIILINTGAVLPLNSMHFVAFGLDRANNLIRLRLKGPGTFSGGTAANINLTMPFPNPIAVADVAYNFSLGELPVNEVVASGTYRNFEDGGYWSNAGYVQGRILSDAEFDYLYAAGAGRAYASLLTDSGH